MLTSSFGCTSSPASAAITSLAFMFEEVPEPVWKTSIGNWSSSSPAATRSPAAAIRSALSASSSPSSRVDARRRGLDAPQPARDRRRDRLAGDREVLDRLARLGAPELPARRPFPRRPSLARPQLHLVAHADRPGADDRAVERERAVEPLDQARAGTDGSRSSVSGSIVVITQRGRSRAIETHAAPPAIFSIRPGQSRSARPSTPPSTRFGRRRRRSRSAASRAPSVVTLSGRTSNRSTPSSATSSASGSRVASRTAASTAGSRQSRPSTSGVPSGRRGRRVEAEQARADAGGHDPAVELQAGRRGRRRCRPSAGRPRRAARPRAT